MGRYLDVDAGAVREVCEDVFDTEARAVITYVPRETQEAAA